MRSAAGSTSTKTLIPKRKKFVQKSSNRSYEDLGTHGDRRASNTNGNGDTLGSDAEDAQQSTEPRGGGGLAGLSALAALEVTSVALASRDRGRALGSGDRKDSEGSDENGLEEHRA